VNSCGREGALRREELQDRVQLPDIGGRQHGHGHRKAELRANGIAWRDRVMADMGSAEGHAAANAHQVSVEFVGEVVALIAA
jgi:hypothetical protein